MPTVIDGTTGVDKIKASAIVQSLTTAQKNALTGVTGMIVFDSTLAKLCIYTGAAWQTVTSV